MKRLKVLKIKKRYYFFIAIFVLVLYLIFAYNYFYFRLHDAHLNWPNNKQTYHFKGSSESTKTYIALGDSLTYGFGADNYEDSYTYQLGKYLSGGGQSITLRDFSYPGYKSGDVLQILDAAVAYKPDIITLFIGVNDTHSLVQSGNFAKNYNQILSRLTTETKAKIYVFNLPYLGAKPVLWPPYNYYFDSKTRATNKEIKILAQKYKASYVDLYSPTLTLFKNKGPQYSEDLYHPSAEGYKIWANIIENDIRQ